MSTIRCDVKQVYYLLGNLSVDQLPLEVALPVFYNTIVKYLNLYRVSPRNFFLKNVDRAVSGVDFALGIEDYGTLMQVQAEVVDPVDGLKHIPIRHVAFEMLRDYEQSGELVCSIYSEGGEIRLRFSRQRLTGLPNRLRIWYEPSLPIEDKYQSDNLIPECFKPLVEYESAAILAPMVRNVDPEVKQSLGSMSPIFMNQALDFRTQFEAIVHKTPENRPYKRSRPRARHRLLRNR